MILLDTNILSELMKASPEHSVLSWVDEQLETDLYLCAISKAEIEWGIGMIDNGKRKLQLQQAASTVFELFAGRCLDYSCEAATNYAAIALHARQTGHPMTVEDLMIAALTQKHNALLVTRNTKDFDGLPGVRLYNPWETKRK